MANEITTSVNLTATTPTATFSIDVYSRADQAGSIAVNGIQRVGVTPTLLNFGDITGKIIHAAAGVVREYTTRRVSDSELVNRLTTALRTP